MKQGRTRSRRIPEINSNLHAVEWSFTLPERNVDRVTHVLICNWFSIHFQHLEVNLMHMECMRLQSSVFYRPILNRPNFGSDGRFFIGIEHSLLLSFHGNIKLNWSVGAAKLFREKELALCSRRL